MFEESYNKAIIVLEHCAKSFGFSASGLKGGYEGLWARDSMITSLGASFIDIKFKAPFQKSLELLSKYQSGLGQIPNAVGDYNTDRKSKITFNTIDSTLWFLIGEMNYSLKFKDGSLLKRHKKNIESAFRWLSYQDICEEGLLDELPTTDWEDAFPEKYGHAINEMSLYYSVLNLYGQKKHALKLWKIINLLMMQL